MRLPLPRRLLRFAERLSFPRLFLLTAALFVLTLIVPDPLPWVDEILLGLSTLLLANLRRRRRPGPDQSGSEERANTK
jgi:hypothetical protein